MFKIRMNWFFHHRQLIRFSLVCLCGLVFYNELLIYMVYSYMWPEMQCGDVKNMHQILLVADPQLLGEQNEMWIARWDNDRYLSQTFRAAVRHVHPELIVFLGDLMDEGSVATDAEYLRYVQRFRDVFQLDNIPANKTLFVPGDNDIGGEDDLVTVSKVNRFKQHFRITPVTKIDNLQVIQVDKMQRIIPAVGMFLPDESVTRIVVSHMPILAVPSVFAAEVLQKVRPNVILSAHDHKSVYFSGDIETGERTLVEALVSNQYADGVPTWRFQNLQRIVNEIVVPTCSYRMGVLEMGYGVVLIDHKGSALCYNVLWLPSRFTSLLMYLIAVVVLVTLFLVTQCSCFLACRSRQRMTSQYRKV